MQGKEYNGCILIEDELNSTQKDRRKQIVLKRV